jgi:hypothetical protein
MILFIWILQEKYAEVEGECNWLWIVSIGGFHMSCVGFQIKLQGSLLISRVELYD